MKEQSSEKIIGIWLSWIFVTGVGCNASLMFFFFKIPSGLMIWIGVFVALFQWVVIDRLFAKSYLWVPITIFGFIVGFSLSDLTAQFTGIPAADHTWLFGVILGGFQWLYLRKNVNFAWLWIPTTSFAWKGFWDEALHLGSALGDTVPFLAYYSFVVGIITGSLLIILNKKQNYLKSP